jgi:hypothetical protein
VGTKDVRSISLSLPSHWFKSQLVCVLCLVAGILVWLWPIGLGGMMPVGGDVTSFFLGLMEVLGTALRDGRLAVWNDLWGYGFPGLAESQMGVFYPVHVILYRALNTETAYVVSLVAHTLWGGLGAYWAARRFGISGAGSALAAFSWTTCGFFVVHLAHPWGYTTGCWMPWAWGLTWCMLAGGSRPRPAAPFLLSLVLVLQVLPGHFQLAFQTQLGMGVMVLWVMIKCWRSRGRGRIATAPADASTSLRGAATVVVAVAAVFPLAAMQLLPTYRLAGLAEGQRDFKYLSGFASTPLHLVNYVAPGLFHRSPLWRPLVWDPFHAMPEEHLAYIGLAPLFLACLAVVREWRRDASVRLLTVLAVVTLVLSLGPYVPGFRALILVHGFSYFRALARWSVATGLALAFLAGKGFDRWPEWSLPGRALLRLIVAAVLWVATIVGILELALWSTSAPGSPAVARGFDGIFRALPWAGDPDFKAVLAHARKPVLDPRISSDLPQAVVLRKSDEHRTFVNQRAWIYLNELAETAALLLALLLVVWLQMRGRVGVIAVRRSLLVITVLDLLLLGSHRLIEVAPLRRLIEQSPVLASLAREPRGTRVADRRLRNLPMLTGSAPISAYRTLDLPAVPQLNAMAQGPLYDPRYESDVRKALIATGTGLRLFDPLESREEYILTRKTGPRETIDDRALAGWLFDSSWAEEQRTWSGFKLFWPFGRRGASWVRDQGPWARAFRVWRSNDPPVKAWLVRMNELAAPEVLADWSGDPRDILRVLETAEPLEAESFRPESWAIQVDADEQAWVIVSQLADPQWKARWISLETPFERDETILPTFQKRGENGGWQRVEVPGSGSWLLRLEYDAQDVTLGVAISAVAWLSWMLAAFHTGFRAIMAVRSAAPRETAET